MTFQDTTSSPINLNLGQAFHAYVFQSEIKTTNS